MAPVAVNRWGYCPSSGLKTLVSLSVPAKMASSVRDAFIQNNWEPHWLQRFQMPESHASFEGAWNCVAAPAVILKFLRATPILGDFRAPVAL